MDKFVEQAQAHGYQITEIVYDGIIHRFSKDGNSRKKNCWYVAHENPRNVIMGDWRSPDSKIHLKEEKKFSKAESKALVEHLRKAQAAQEKAREVLHMQTAHECAKKFSRGQAFADANHEYLRKKEISLHGARVLGNVILVPLRDVKGTIWSLQEIYPNGKKMFVRDGRIKGNFFLIGEIEDEAYLCEGYSTACSIHQATKGTVIAAMSAANLFEVAKELTITWPHLRILVCADDDRATEEKIGENPGIIGATKAANLVGTKCVAPQFQSYQDDPSDFNDLAVREGLKEVKRQLAVDRAIQIGWRPLGKEGNNYYYYIRSCHDIIRIHHFTRANMFMLAPIDYWAAAFGNSKGGVDWDKAITAVIQGCHRRGIFNPTRVRGTGVWLDAGRVVINTGKELILDERKMSPMEIQSSYYYVQSKNKIPSPSTEPLVAEEGQKLAGACMSMRWRNNPSGYLLAGWLFLARIAGALPIRPHVWLSGPSGSGKSFLMEEVVNPALGYPASRIYVQGGSTEAGIRQAVRSDALPIIYDEFEINNRQNKMRQDAVLEWCRQSWSRTSGSIVKGTKHGEATSFQLSSAVLVSSIRVGIDNDADRSRFSILELRKHDSSEAELERIEQASALVTEELGERLFARAAKLTPNIIACYNVFRRILARRESQRFGSQYGMLLAGYWMLVHEATATDKQARDLIEKFDFDVEAAHASPDEEDCLTHLLTSRITIRDLDNHITDLTIEEALAEETEETYKGLKSHGIWKDGEWVFIANNHRSLHQIFENTRWQANWRGPLSRLESREASSNHIKRFAGHVGRCVKIRLQPKSNA